MHGQGALALAVSFALASLVPGGHAACQAGTAITSPTLGCKCEVIETAQPCPTARTARIRDRSTIAVHLCASTVALVQTCSLYSVLVQDTYGCDSRRNCSVNYVPKKVACEDYKVMASTLCSAVTQAQVDTAVIGLETAGNCKNKADGGVAFAPQEAATTTAPTITPAPVAKAPADTKFFVTLTVTLPYTKADFDDKAKKDKFRAAVAAAAGTIAENVKILSITEKRRRAGSVDVETKIRASDQEGMDVVATALGSGDDLKTKINAELTKQGLEEATGVTAPTKAEMGASPASSKPAWVLLLSFAALIWGLVI